MSQPHQPTFSLARSQKRTIGLISLSPWHTDKQDEVGRLTVLYSYMYRATCADCLFLVSHLDSTFSFRSLTSVRTHRTLAVTFSDRHDDALEIKLDKTYVPGERNGVIDFSLCVCIYGIGQKSTNWNIYTHIYTDNQRWSFGLALKSGTHWLQSTLKSLSSLPCEHGKKAACKWATPTLTRKARYGDEPRKWCTYFKIC